MWGTSKNGIRSKHLLPMGIVRSVYAARLVSYLELNRGPQVLPLQHRVALCVHHIGADLVPQTAVAQRVPPSRDHHARRQCVREPGGGGTGEAGLVFVVNVCQTIGADSHAPLDGMLSVVSDRDCVFVPPKTITLGSSVPGSLSRWKGAKLGFVFAMSVQT